MADLEQLRQEAENLRKKIRVCCEGGWEVGREICGRECRVEHASRGGCTATRAPHNDVAELEGWSLVPKSATSGRPS